MDPAADRGGRGIGLVENRNIKALAVVFDFNRQCIGVDRIPEGTHEVPA